MLRSVTLLGSSSGRNAGDAALLSSIMDSVDEACGTKLLYEIPTLKPEFIWQTYENRVRPIGILPWNFSAKLFGLPTYQSLMRTDLSLVFDATLFDRSLYNPFFNFLSSYNALLPLAKKKGKRMACYTVSIGPVSTPKGKDMLRRVLEMMDFISVRDQDAVDMMRDAGVQNPNVIITNDVALNTKPASPERIEAIWRTFGFDPSKEVLAINMNPYFDSWAGLNRDPLTKDQFVDIYSRGLKLALKDIDANLLFVSTQHLDVTLTREVMSRIDTGHRKAFFSNTEYNHHEIKGVMGKVNLLFAMRLHCLILTSSALGPIASLNYLPKVTTYMKSLGLSDYALSFENFNPEAIGAHVLKSWNDRGSIRRKLEELIPQMQYEANKAAELVAVMHRGEDVGQALARLKSEPRGMRVANA
ncbi:MAG: polysaccharide pyruvyl transferase family protein [Bdellovibrionota bacterium]